MGENSLTLYRPFQTNSPCFIPLCRIKGIYQLLEEQSKVLKSINQQKQEEEEFRRSQQRKISRRLVPQRF